MTTNSTVIINCSNSAKFFVNAVCVYIDTGRTKPEVIKAIMEAVETGLPWPEQPQKLGLEISGKRKVEPFAPVFPRKMQTSRFQSLPQAQPLGKFLETESSKPNLFNVLDTSNKPFSNGNTPQNSSLKVNMSYERELGVFLRLYTSDDLKYSGKPNNSIKI